ncbi:hypothetical protein IOQ59_08300 [Pontibacterium sp. N1Y112]|uniref:Uncharacterized protein n=1 Tax=Pontibacterium sinense TaxID=2781979 RepID=A0A8J7FJE1_9GAMM|nr:DUF5677 domain-containing protein [Pontibacterium sinense]MBE9397258.1 hypothetical protein [Pontibacterium sinense]
MSTFEKVGFLADDMASTSDALCTEYGAYLDVCKELNEFSQKLQYEFEVNTSDPAQLLSAILFTRVLSTYQASLLVAQRGMKQQLKMLIRCALELYPLVAISKDRDFVFDLIKSEEVERNRNIKKIIKFKERNKEEGDELEEARRLHKELDAKIKKEKLKKVSVFDCAQKAELADWYDTLYALMSSTLHSSIRSLEEALHMDEEQKNILALKSEPDIEGFDDLLIALAECLMNSLLAVSKVLSMDEPEIVELCSAKIRALRGAVA